MSLLNPIPVDHYSGCVVLTVNTTMGEVYRFLTAEQAIEMARTLVAHADALRGRGIYA